MWAGEAKSRWERDVCRRSVGSILGHLAEGFDEFSDLGALIEVLRAMIVEALIRV